MDFYDYLKEPEVASSESPSRHDRRFSLGSPIAKEALEIKILGTKEKRNSLIMAQRISSDDSGASPITKEYQKKLFLGHKMHEMQKTNKIQTKNMD